MQYCSPASSSLSQVFCPSPYQTLTFDPQALATTTIKALLRSAAASRRSVLPIPPLAVAYLGEPRHLLRSVALGVMQTTQTNHLVSDRVLAPVHSLVRTSLLSAVPRETRAAHSVAVRVPSAPIITTTIIHLALLEHLALQQAPHLVATTRTKPRALAVRPSQHIRRRMGHQGATVTSKAFHLCSLIKTLPLKS